MAVATMTDKGWLARWARARNADLGMIPDSEIKSMLDSYASLLEDPESGQIVANTFREDWLADWLHGKRLQNGRPCLIYVVGKRTEARVLGFTDKQFENWEHFVLSAAFTNGATGCGGEWGADNETRIVEARFAPRRDPVSGEYLTGKVKVPGDVSDLRIELQPRNIVVTWSLYWQYEMKIMETRRKKIDDLSHLIKSIY